jgi:TM2 domain
LGLPAAVKIAESKLDPKLRKAFNRDFARRRKSLIAAYLAWFLLGWHYLYLGRIGLQFAFWFTLGGIGLWWLMDFFRLPGIVTRLNEDMARELMAQYRIMA